MKRLFALLLAISALASFAACGGRASSISESSSGTSSSQPLEESSAAAAGRFDALHSTDEPLTLRLDFHGYKPSVNEEPTEENPNVFNSSRTLSEEWLTDKPNIEIDWVRNKNGGATDAELLEWMNIQLNAGTAPDLWFAWGSVFATQGWYVTLNEIIESPNYYEPGNPTWKDMYPEYLWKDAMHVDANEDVIAIPFSIFPGPPTCYFYNPEIFEEVGISPSTDWDTFFSDLQKVTEAGYIAFDPAGAGAPVAGNWDMQFSMRGYAMKDTSWDLDGDGIMSAMESIRSLWNGMWYMETNPGIQEVWQIQKDKYVNVVGVGNDAVDYAQDWIDGKLAVREAHVGETPAERSNTKRTFEFGQMPPPIKSSEYTGTIQWTESGPYMPQPMEAYNIMNPEIQDRPEAIVDYCVDFMKFVSTTENQSVLVEERQGAVMGAVKTCAVPTILAEWYTQSFPMNPTVSIPVTSTSDPQISKLLEQYMLDMVTEEAFISSYDRLVYQDLLRYIENNNVDVSEWGEAYVPASARE